MKAIPGEFQQVLVVAEMDKNKKRDVVRKTCTERRISLLKDVKIWKRFEKRNRISWCWSTKFLRTFEGWGLEACDEVCGKKMERSKGDIWWWNEELKEAVSRKKNVHKTMCWNSTEKNKSRHIKMKNIARKTVSRAMSEKPEEVLTELKIVKMKCLG